MEEFVDIYNEQKQKTGNIIDKYGPFEKGEYYLTTHIWIKYTDLWLIQKRSGSRKNNPNKWSVTGGAVKSGETSIQAAARELSEELNIRIPIEKFKFVDYYRQKHSFVDVYLIELTNFYSKIDFNKTEVSDVKWCTEKEIIDKYKSEELVQSIYPGFQIVNKILQNHKKTY